MNWLGLNRLVFWLVRQLLGLLVKTRVHPDDTGQLRIDPEKPVCYVLKNRAMSDLLVLDEECKRAGLPRPTDGLQLDQLRFSNAAFFLVQPQGRFIRKPRTDVLPDKLIQLVEYTRGNEQQDVQLIPVSIFWGRMPDKERSVFKLLFSDSWAVPGWVRKLFIIMAQGRQTLVYFSEPVSLAQLTEQSPDTERMVRKAARILRVHFRRLRETVVGPDLSHKRTIVNTLLRLPNVDQAVQDDAQQHNQSVEKAAKKARAYAEEIAADYSYPVIRLYDVVLTWLWNKLYDGVRVNHFEHLDKVAKDNVVIYVPCHRSHIDYLLMSYVLFHKGHVPPHIAAGVNLNLPVLGGILRRGGAFFLRRSFKGNPLYATIFNEYLNLVFERGFSVEYFVEGGRSRTGRLLQPRPGMVAMTVRSFLRSRRRSFVFVPVYFGYERILEGRTYVGELYGAKKKKESLLDIFRTLQRIRGTFGQVHVNFGRPIHLNDLLDDCCADWRQQPFDEENPPEWLPSAVERLGDRIVTHINEAAVVNPVSLLSLVILATPRRAVDEKALRQQLDHYLTLLHAIPYSQTAVICDHTSEEIIAYTEKLNILTRKTHPLGDILSVEDDKAMLLTYFRNNNIHLLALPSFMACLLINNRVIDTATLLSLCRQMYPFLRSELFIHWDDSIIGDQIGAYIEQFERLQWVSLESGRLVTAAPSSEAFASLTLMSRIIRPTLERYYIAINIMLKRGNGQLQRTQLENLCCLAAERISLLHEFNAPEFFDKALFRNFLDALMSHQMIWEEDDRLMFDERLSDAELGTNLILSNDLRQTIQHVTEVNLAEAEEPPQKTKADR